MRARQRRHLGQLARQGRRLHPVRLGQHELERHRRPVQQFHHRRGRPPSPRSAHPAAASRAAASGGRAGSRTSAPASPAFTVLAAPRIAVARHVHQRQPPAEIEEIELPRAPRLGRDARQRAPPGQRVQQRRLADIRAARRTPPPARAGGGNWSSRCARIEEPALGGEQQPPRLERRCCRVGVGPRLRCARARAAPAACAA